ncbi:MAG: PEP-CTERM sorting domain-containing protein [Pirellulales bacterium]
MALCVACVLSSRAALAIDFEGVQAAAFDQPRVNVLVQPGTGGDPYSFDFLGIETFNILAFLDTGSSGTIISSFAADALEIPRQPGVTFSDVAIGGTTEFDVTPPVLLRIAPSTSLEIDDPNTFETVYDQAYGPMRMQIGPTNVPQDPNAEPLDIVGMPVMMGKTVVMDPKPLNDLSDLMHTFIYNPGTPFNSELADTDPGIPSTSHHVQLSYGDFDRFTQTTPDGASPPQTNHNPFIGPNPLLQLEENPPVDNTPPVRVGFGGLQASGSFLLDTGAAASFISTDFAAKLNVRYGPETPLGDPQLETFDPLHPEDAGTIIAGQFLLPIQGIGGAVSVAGFFLDELLLQTLEGSSDPNDPDNIRYVGAPVLVADVTLFDPLNEDVALTLDGIFGMNFLVASASLDLEHATVSPYNWITYDEGTGILGLDIAFVPEPGSLALAALGTVLVAGYGWRRRRATRCRG